MGDSSTDGDSTVGVLVDSEMSSEVLDPAVEGMEIDGNDNVQEEGQDPSRKFQKENHLLRNLPYYEELQGETEEYFEKIIVNLAKAVLCRDFQLGVLIYAKSLKVYVGMYGRKFNKEQHIKLVELFMEILTSKECPLNLINDVADVLATLLRKPELLTRDDIVIKWRPLCETLDRCCFHRKYTLSYNAAVKLESNLKDVVRLSNVYFEKGTFAEVVEEFRPTLCPTSPKMLFGLEMLKHFIPFLDPDCETEVNKFLQELLKIYDSWNNGPTWEWTMLGLFSTASWNMPGSFDWTPYLPSMYARIMKNLELPVHFKGAKNQIQRVTHAPTPAGLKQFDFASLGRWMVSTLGNRPEALKHLCTFLKSVETYFNPTNYGRWTAPLGSLLNELVSSFTNRLRKERYNDNHKRWWYRIPEDRKLSDEEIDKFVKVTSYIVLDYYLDVNMCGFVLKNLACIRPNIIIPAVMEKYEGIVETVTEPRKYMTTLRWVTIVLFPMISSRKEVEGYDGRKLVLPFAMSLLPAIDPNDMFKTLSALGCLHGLMNIPLVDCSAMADSLEDEEERDLCISTSCLEDFLVQFLDRILNLIDSRTVENTRMADSRAANEGSNMEDQSLEKFIWAVFHRIASQSSTKICKHVFKKVASFALGNTLETAVSGRLFASILQAFVVARPDITLPKILPQLCASIRSHVTDDILDDEDLDKALLFQLLLLSYLTETTGTELLKYRSDLESTFTCILKLNGKKAYTFSSHSISRCLQSLLYIYPLECKVSEKDYDDPNYLAIKDWGVTVDPKKVKTTWHIRNQEEYDWAKELFLKIFMEYSSKLEKVKELKASDPDVNKRLLKNLHVFYSAYCGVSTILRFWDDVPIDISSEGVADLSPDRYDFGIPKPDLYVPGTTQLISEKYYEVYCSVFNYLQSHKADDVDAYIALMRGFDSLVFAPVESERRMAPEKKNSVTNSLMNALDPKKKHTRGSLIARAYDVHMRRVRCASCTTWTNSHITVMQSMYKLCINHYARVRVNAQRRFFMMVEMFDGLIARSVTNFFEPYLKEGMHHDEYKGTLYTLLGRGTSSVLLVNNWKGIRQLWLSLVRSPFSEKDSIIKIMDRIKNSLTQNFVYHPLDFSIRDDSKILDLARALLTKDQLASMSINIIQTPENKDHFLELMKGLTNGAVGCVEEGATTHWRRQVMCSNMLSVLMVDDPQVPLTREVVEIFYEGLISHSIDIRRSSMSTISWMMVLYKRKYEEREINTKTCLNLPPGQSVHSVLQYKTSNQDKNETPFLPFTPEDNGVSHPIYIHKVHHGYASLPPKLKVKLPCKDFSDHKTQQSLGRQLILEATQKYFTNEEYIKKLLGVWGLEDKSKAKSNKRMSICKSVARNSGPEGLKLLVKAVHSLGTDKDQWKQKCAAEVLCGIIFGMKLWNEEDTEKFWESELKPVFTDCLNSVTQETINTWCAALQYPTLNRDPNRMRFFIEFVRERFMNSLETAQTTSVDAYKEISFFDQVITNLQWRGGDLYFETLDLVKKHFFDSVIPYMNVRTQFGRVLSSFFEWDLIEQPTSSSESQKNGGFSPKYKDFVDFLFNLLQNLEEEAAKYRANEKDSEENKEIRKLLLTFKTSMEFIIASTCDNEASVHPTLFRFIPLFCQFESYDPDPEVSALSCLGLAGLSRTLVHANHMEDMLQVLSQAASSPSWKARLCVLQFLKVFALNNTSLFTSNEKWGRQVLDLVLKLLSDRKLEVRESSSKILCGFLHCLVVKEPMELLKSFQKVTDTFKRNRQRVKNGKRDPLTPEEVDKAHAGILGLCAFVDCHPYHVPAHLPDILVVLTTHLHDPQPIPGTIRKCLSDFRRTHHDNWAVHKTKFTEDQLCILTDIFVSPCYYA